jgi:serine/threonine-protein kinase RsbW
MTDAAEAAFEARMDDLPAAAAFVEAFCERNGIDVVDALRLTLVVEELFSNIVRHGYGAQSRGPIRLGLALEGRDVHVVCEDRAPPYDPRPSLKRMPEDLGEPVETRRVGGLGHWLVGRLVVVTSYVRQDDANVLVLRFRRSAEDR